MFKIKPDTAPAGFQIDFREISHHSPTGFSQSNFEEGKILSDRARFAVSS